MLDFIRRIVYRLYTLGLNGEKLRKKAKNILSGQQGVLDIYGFESGTDKASLIAEGSTILPAHDYLRHYDYFFHSFRGAELILVEFGCYRGESLSMWREYFPKANIVGVDLDEEVKQYEKERIHIVIGDVTSEDTYQQIEEYCGDKQRPFIILDDASHAWGDQRRSLELFWKLLLPGGFYVVEDLQCGTLGAYPWFPPKVRDSQPFFEYVQERCKLLRYPVDAIPSNLKWLDELPLEAKMIETQLDACFFVPGAIILRKKTEVGE